MIGLHRRFRTILYVAAVGLFPFLSTQPIIAAGLVPVDLELVLAVDTSGSVDGHEAQLQRDGYVAALKSEALHKAVETGILGRIAVTYVEWAGEGYQTTVLDWAVIQDAPSANHFAEQLAGLPLSSGPWTSISGVIRYAMPLFANNTYQGTRRVIDISGDGPNNMGELVTEARDAAVRQGIVINGLPIVNDRPQFSGRRQIKGLDQYYSHCVIGGPGAFIVVAEDFKDFARAIRRKLIFEIADIVPSNALEDAPITPTRQVAFEQGCDVGERRMRERRLRFDNEF